MVRSMTGFASTSLTITAPTGSPVTITAHLKSLNARYFEVTCKLPYQLTTLEMDLVNTIKKHLSRGHISLVFHVDNQELFIGSIEPALGVIQGYIDAVNRIKKQYPIAGDLTVGDMLQLPDVFYTQPKSIDTALRRHIFTMLETLIAHVITAQETEGRALLHDIQQRITIAQNAIVAIEQATTALVHAQKEKTSKIVQEMSEDPTKHSVLQKDAAYALLDKIDVHEEIVRFKSHLQSVQRILASSEHEVGKRLDFTLQELSREINTIGAKCSDATISALVINVKVELEKAREQVQNIV